MKLPKLANWFSEGDLEKYKQQARQTEQALIKLQNAESELAQLRDRLRTTQKELTQAEAQLQINQGFQIELGETQLKLRQTEAEAHRYKKELFAREKQYKITESQIRQARALTESQNWPQQLKNANFNRTDRKNSSQTRF